jgi:SH3-like domain-containing protein
MIARLLLIVISTLFCYNVFSQNYGIITGLEIPRFVSLKSNDVNLRIGSSTNYPIILKYIKKNYPVEINKEYENWRKIKDIDGNEGWIHKNLIKGERFAIINNNKNTKSLIFLKPEGKTIGQIGNLNIVKIEVCLQDWCKISLGKHKGWISKKKIWGIYDNEFINVPIYQFILNQFWKLF